MKMPHKSDSDSGAGGSSGGRRKNEGSRRSKRKETPSEVSPRSNANISDLPPNENIRKRADEVYGDTEIPARKPGA
jgi:hypothetical protein